MTDRVFRYYKEDFGRIPIRVIHMDIVFDVFDDHTKVTSELHSESRENQISELVLNTKNLEVLSVTCAGHECSYDYDASNNKLMISFRSPVPPRTRFTVRTETICRPTKNILEGLYYDETPSGAPPQQITQCQQWGFQRLVPCIDDMVAKCTYRTTIIADERYSNLITNGDIVSPRQSVGGGRTKMIYENVVTPMAPYLFFLGCGTYSTFIQECEYPNGHCITLELLVPPTADPGIAMRALDILHDAVLWVYLFTGPDRYGRPEIRERLYRLVSELRKIKTADPGSPRIPAIRSELKTLLGQIVPGYEYTGKTYREIAMQNSDFGGMENVGNTTITANRIMPYPTMIDPAYEYMAKVKAHEYYHNLNGSEVTGWSPFEIWLNEAVTVHIENQYHAFHYGEDYARLETVTSLLAPVGGTLEHDRGAASLPIEPDGFNDPNELITGITYMKAPEFVRMIETLMGKEAFVKGLDQYHREYRHGNATREQWLRAMEQASGQEFMPMAEGWLKQTGYPTLTVQAAYDRGKMIVNLRQSGDAPGKLWIFPVRIALVSETGRDITEVLHRFDKAEDTLEIESPERPAFLSINRGFSFYGEVKYDAPLAELYLQVERDQDITNRFIAFTKIMDREKIRSLDDREAPIGQECIDLYYRLLSDKDLMMRSGGQFLTIFESVPDMRYAHDYQGLFEIREKILRSIAARHKEGLLAIYKSHDRPNDSMDTTAGMPLAIKQRQVKSTALAVLSRLDTPDIHRLIREQFESATGATDKLTAFALYMESSAEDRFDMLATFEQESEKDLVSWQNFLSIIAGNSSPEVMDLITRIERSSAFRIEQANDQRALYVRFAMNRKKSLQAVEGRAFLQRALLTLAPINEHSTVAMLRVFGALDEMKEEDQVPLVEILKRLLEDLDQEKTPSVYNNVRHLLAASPKAVKAYEKSRI